MSEQQNFGKDRLLCFGYGLVWAETVFYEFSDLTIIGRSSFVAPRLLHRNSAFSGIWGCYKLILHIVCAYWRFSHSLLTCCTKPLSFVDDHLTRVRVNVVYLLTNVIVRYVFSKRKMYKVVDIILGTRVGTFLYI